jgi:hypothetical protein
MKAMSHISGHFGCRLSVGWKQQPVISVSPGLQGEQQLVMSVSPLAVFCPLFLPLFLAYIVTVVNLPLADRTRNSECNPLSDEKRSSRS